MTRSERLNDMRQRGFGGRATQPRRAGPRLSLDDLDAGRFGPNEPPRSLWDEDEYRRCKAGPVIVHVKGGRALTPEGVRILQERQAPLGDGRVDRPRRRVSIAWAQCAEGTQYCPHAPACKAA